jgi:hypothetical protein
MWAVAIFGLLSATATVFVWRRIWHAQWPLAAKITVGLLAAFPVLGPLMGLFVTSAPEPAPEHLRATMNHYGRGGRFIGFGSGRFNHNPGQSGTGEDWNPTVPEIIEQKRKHAKKKQT